MPVDDLEEHKQFLKENLSDLSDSSDIAELYNSKVESTALGLSVLPVVGVSDQGVWV